MLRKKITIELENRYYNKYDLSNAVLEFLVNTGHQCSLIDEDTIILNGNKYLIQEWNTNVIVPLQQVVLKLIK